jgi:serine phosphatase RsbU (regulator of sigma subunit)
VLRALNRYVHLTLANHSVYATALCLRVDPVQGVVEWASGGHPPAFLRAVDGTIDRLPSTSFVLGAVPDEAFSHGQQSHRFGPGDTLIAYTDGATEARNEAGRMLGVTGLERILASTPPAFDGGWASVILSAVEAHRLGPARDDTLVVEIVRTLGLDTDSLKTRSVRLREETPATV